MPRLATQAAAELLATVPHVMATLRADLRRCGSAEHAHFRVLAALLHGPRATGDLADSFRVSAPTMSRTIDLLVGRGLVDRRRDAADRRRVLVELTPSGREEFDRLRGEAEAHLASLLAEASDDELQRLVDGLDALRAVLERRRGRGDPCSDPSSEGVT